jgi:hypothetical protein
VVIGQTSNTTLPASGDGTYYVYAVAKPTPGISVYSLMPAEISVSGFTQIVNLVASQDEAPGWTGSKYGFYASSGDLILISGQFNSGVQQSRRVQPRQQLTWYRRMAKVGPGARRLHTRVGWQPLRRLNTGDLNAANNMTGIYTPRPAQTITMNAVTASAVAITYVASAQSVQNDWLSSPDLLAITDWLSAGSVSGVTITPQINLSQDGVNYAGWQNYVPGVYTFKTMQYRLVATSLNPNTYIIVTDFLVKVSAPNRLDGTLSGTPIALPAVGQTLVYPNGPFNIVPNLQVTILDAVDNDKVRIPLSLATQSQFFLQITNAGTGVARNILYTAQGY